jgi:hypothetical protein
MRRVFFKITTAFKYCLDYADVGHLGSEAVWSCNNALTAHTASIFILHDLSHGLTTRKSNIEILKLHILQFD